jgi:hypothetical protein
MLQKRHLSPDHCDATNGSLIRSLMNTVAFLNEGLVQLLSSRSRQVCITCHWFRHHAGVNCIPLLNCQLHEGLISHCDPSPIVAPAGPRIWPSSGAGCRREVA